jgi:diketogulonate reductase-like aldo/keto reductase
MSGSIPTVELPCGVRVPALGQGTWYMAEEPSRRKGELAALQRGIELGLTLIDTAEMYGDGASEELVGEAIAGRRDRVFLVSKVLPWNASREGTIEACEQSLRRLRTDRIDLYLLHWRGEAPFEETIAAFEELVEDGKIGSWGVSNLDTDEMDELLSAGGAAVQVDQVLYNLSRRGIEWDLLPRCRARDVAVMAYSPVEQGRILGHPALRQVAGRHGATPAQVALAWTLREEGVITIPKAGTLAHVEENRAALDLRLTAQDLSELDRAFPPPRSKRPLEML